MRKCKCECGQKIEKYDSRGRERFFVKGHCSKGLKRRPMDIETKKKIAKALTGKKTGIVTSSAFKKGQEPWNKNKKTGLSPWKGKRRPDIGEKLKKRWREGKMNFMKGRIVSIQTKEKLSQSKQGDKNPSWAGGISPLSMRIRKSREYGNWRRAVFERDNYVCQFCNIQGRLHADHLKTFSSILKDYKIKTFKDAQLCNFLWDISNGRTLCKGCHLKTETYGNKLYFELKKKGIEDAIG